MLSRIYFLSTAILLMLKALITESAIFPKITSSVDSSKKSNLVPFAADDAYLFATMILSLADPRRTFVMNSPSGLREANEKLYALNFPGAIPPTMVTYEIARLKQFMKDQGGEMIVKPLDGHGGESVFLARSDDRNLNPILEAVTRFESRPIMAPALYPGNPRRRQARDPARR